MSQRQFNETFERQEGRHMKVARVTCGKCGVSRSQNIQLSGGGYIPPPQIKIKFEQAGWTIGKDGFRDMCPGCTAALKNKEKPALKIVPSAPAQPAKPAPTPSETPPRTMGRDDRRIIFEKLNEVYLDERRGYDTGWSDQRVAADLGVPRKWVETIRVENFGDTAGNEEALQFLTDANALLHEARELAGRCEATLATINSRIAKLQSTADDIKKAMGIK